MLRNIIWYFVFEFNFRKIIWIHIENIFNRRNMLINANFAAHLSKYINNFFI